MGNYIKNARGVSQTPWKINDELLHATSVETEILKYIEPHFRPKSTKFHSGGREDVDVRMLGQGRPFVMEL